jgi:ribosomal protein S18 acetylase RimI-like enzyme
LQDDRHHLLVAREGDDLVGFVSGVEMTHPDKGTEMFLYELAVDDDWQRQGIGVALVNALADLARDRDCYGMWVLTDDDNDAALATYTSAGGSRSNQVMLDWEWSPRP